MKLRKLPCCNEIRTGFTIFNDFCAISLEKAMAPHSSTLAWKIPWAEEPGKPQSMGSLRVGYDWATSLSCIEEGNGNPLQCSCLQNPRDGGAWWAAVYGVAQSRTRLKRLSSSSAIYCTRTFGLFFLAERSHCWTCWYRELSHGYRKILTFHTDLYIRFLLLDKKGKVTC